MDRITQDNASSLPVQNKLVQIVNHVYQVFAVHAQYVAIIDDEVLFCHYIRISPFIMLLSKWFRKFLIRSIYALH